MCQATKLGSYGSNTASTSGGDEHQVDMACTVAAICLKHAPCREHPEPHLSPFYPIPESHTVMMHRMQDMLRERWQQPCLRLATVLSPFQSKPARLPQSIPTASNLTWSCRRHCNTAQACMQGGLKRMVATVPHPSEAFSHLFKASLHGCRNPFQLHCFLCTWSCCR